MAKKTKPQVKIGITGEGKDYTLYKMNLRETIIGYLIGFAAGCAGAQIMFGVMIASLIIGLTTGFIAGPLYGKYLQGKQHRLILSQYRDLLDSLSNSFSAGKNTPNAFIESYNDMKLAHGDKAPITQEVGIILAGLHSNFTIEDLLKDMAYRCGIDDMNSFAETFAVSNRLGGNLKKMVTDSKDIINDKIEIEMEIQTTLAATRNEINIMSVMPFVIVLMMNLMSEEAITTNNLTNIIVKLIAIGMFAAAYIIAKKLTAIKV
ncbi:MAG: kinase [Peptococcaceae bacterium]|nr:kinase [Peptococcaceae bacterium]